MFAKRSALGGAVLSRTRFILLVLLGLAVSMEISYGLVRHLTKGMSLNPAGDPVTIRKATILRNSSNELIRLMEEYLKGIPLAAGSPKPSVRQWIARSFMSRVTVLRGQLDDESLLYLPPYRELSAAVERLAAMAAHPEDVELRRRAVSMVLNAVLQTEQYIDSLKVSPYLPEPPVKPAFAK